MQLIPAIDLRHGGVVRLAQGDDTRRTDYDPSPDAMLEAFAEAGCEMAHVVDLDAAFGELPQRRLLSQLGSVAADLGLAVELGGGLRDRDAVSWALDAGFARVVIGSLVVRDFATFGKIVRAFPRRVVPAVEVAGDELRIAGWREKAGLGLDELCRQLRDLDCPAVLVTDVDRDGTLIGPNLELARRVGVGSGLPAIVSGGVRELDDLAAAVEVPEIAGVVVGKALYEGMFGLEAALEVCGGKRRDDGDRDGGGEP